MALCQGSTFLAEGRLGRWKLFAAMGLALTILSDWRSLPEWQMPIWQLPPIEAVPREARAYRDWLVEREAIRQGVDPRMMLAVALVENAKADPLAVSPAGAIGLLQVMPAWVSPRVVFPECGGNNLFDSRVNVCTGVSVFRYYLERCNGELNCALARYNGAVTPWRVELYIEQVGAKLEGL